MAQSSPSSAITEGKLGDRQSSARPPVGRSTDDLTSPSPDRIANILWPIPIFERLREQQHVDVGDLTIRPGDVLETLDAAHREAMLVVSVLPHAIAINPAEAADARPHLLVYSDEFQTFRVVNAAYLYSAPDADRTLRVGDGPMSWSRRKAV